LADAALLGVLDLLGVELLDLVVGVEDLDFAGFRSRTFFSFVDIVAIEKEHTDLKII